MVTRTDVSSVSFLTCFVFRFIVILRSVIEGSQREREEETIERERRLTELVHR